MEKDSSNPAPHIVRPVVAPLERLKLPAHLDGSMLPRGSRLFKLRIEARNDLEAIQMWLAEVTQCTASFRSYRAVAERCLLWATIERNKPLTAIDENDICDYARFLLCPHPPERWQTGGAYLLRRDDSWRPFRGPLSPASRRHALGILAGLFEWFEVNGYLIRNPWHGYDLDLQRRGLKELAPAAVVDRFAGVVTAVEWSHIRKSLDELGTAEDEPNGLRTKALMYLAYYGDMQVSEICSLRTSAIGLLAPAPTPVWTLNIECRSPQTAEIILLPPAQQALEEYLASRGLMCGGRVLELDSPLIASSRCTGDEPESAASLARSNAAASTRDVFLRASELAMTAGDATAARRLSGASLQWLRHALEVHASQIGAHKNWTWFLLGSSWLAPTTKTYLPPRTCMSAASALCAFNDLKELWEKEGRGN